MEVVFTYNSSNQTGVVQTDLLPLIREKFSIVNKGAEFAKRRGYFFIPDRIHMISMNGNYDPGLTFSIIKWVKEYNPNMVITIDPLLLDVIHPKKFTSFTDIQPTLGTFTLRDYQLAAVKSALQYGRGVIRAETGAGKTLIMASLLNTLYNALPNFKALVIVPDIGLVNQTFKDFTNYCVDFKFNRWTGNYDLEPNTNIIISNLGILQNRKHELKTISNVDVCIVDEVHKVRKDNKVNKILKSIPTNYKYGFTGTMPPDNHDYWNIVGKFGPIIFDVDRVELIKKEAITAARIHVIKVYYKTSPDYKSCDKADTTSKYRLEHTFIKKSEFRNNLIKKISHKAVGNSLILLDHIEHGELLTDYLKHNSDKQIYFIRGEVEVEDRDKVKQVMESNNDVICVAISKIFSTGISINNIHNIIFAGGGKAKIKILQSIGRGVRIHELKKELSVYDIADMLEYGETHLQSRIKIYNENNLKYDSYHARET